MNKFYEAPEYDISEENLGRRIFLAGTIDMGNSNNWQDSLIKKLKEDKYSNIGVTIYNPRRESFDNKDLDEQIKWELDHLDKCDIILMNLLPDSKSPISLLELGLYAKSGKLHVVCPKSFYRYNNVKLVCDKYNIPLYESANKIVITKLFKS